jgi:trehalose 6-phosphate synthase/phosphatase
MYSIDDVYLCVLTYVIGRLFQCRQCQDLLENNVAHKRPIEGIISPFKVLRVLSCSVVLVGKKNLEVRPLAINKGEIVKRILYLNPDAEFVFCAGDDKVRLLQLPLFV